MAIGKILCLLLFTPADRGITSILRIGVGGDAPPGTVAEIAGLLGGPLSLR